MGGPTVKSRVQRCSAMSQVVPEQLLQYLLYMARMEKLEDSVGFVALSLLEQYLATRLATADGKVGVAFDSEPLQLRALSCLQIASKLSGRCALRAYDVQRILDQPEVSSRMAMDSELTVWQTLDWSLRCYSPAVALDAAVPEFYAYVGLLEKLCGRKKTDVWHPVRSRRTLARCGSCAVSAWH